MICDTCIHKEVCYENEEDREALKTCADYLNLVKNQKMGHWKYTTHYARRYRVCSVCGWEKLDDCSTGWNYCPYCSAKMNGEQ